MLFLVIEACEIAGKTYCEVVQYHLVAYVTLVGCVYAIVVSHTQGPIVEVQVEGEAVVYVKSVAPCTTVQEIVVVSETHFVVGLSILRLGKETYNGKHHLVTGGYGQLTKSKADRFSSCDGALYLYGGTAGKLLGLDAVYLADRDWL